MLKALVTFGLTRRPIVLLLLAAFCVGGGIAFTKLNIEAYPNPAPVILEITAQSAGLSAEEMERLYTIPMEVGLAPKHRRRCEHTLDFFLRFVFCSRYHSNTESIIISLSSRRRSAYSKCKSS